VLGRAARPGAGPLPPAAGSDADATQYIAPVPGGPGAQAPYGGGADRQQPPVEFDNLFRGGPGGDAHAGATQQMPQVPRPEQPGHGAQPAYIPPRSGRDEDGGDERRRGGRSGSRLPLIAAVGVAIAVLGVGAGALLGSSGDEDDGKDGGSTTVSATAPATSAAPSPSADPARQQAVALDKLLADSGSSRATVIKAVADVKGCRNLGQAAADLRDAGRQRNDLVTRLAALQVDKLPDHAALTSALTDAWKASASADDHYAAWADQVAKNKGKLCKKGQARSTDQTVAANKSSNTASAQKKTAAGLWNAIARTYGLSERQATQL
jgi:chorismate mutase